MHQTDPAISQLSVGLPFYLRKPTLAPIPLWFGVLMFELVVANGQVRFDHAVGTIDYFKWVLTLSAQK